MQSSPKSIFRPEAVRRYAERAADPVFPKSAMRRAFMLLWSLLGLLGLLAFLAFSSSVPIYARGVAAFALPDRQDLAGKLVVILVPTDQVARLQIGQRVLIRPGLLHDVETARINFIYPEILSPQQIHDLADNTASSALTVAGSKVVALAELDPASANVRGGFPGGREALVEVGSRRVLTLIRWGNRQSDYQHLRFPASTGPIWKSACYQVSWRPFGRSRQVLSGRVLNCRAVPRGQKHLLERRQTNVETGCNSSMEGCRVPGESDGSSARIDAAEPRRSA